jgi:hypothetical protein
MNVANSTGATAKNPEDYFAQALAGNSLALRNLENTYHEIIGFGISTTQR